MGINRQTWRKIPRPVRRLIVLVIGLIFVAAGCFMLVLPGPGWATIFLGLAILATEFERAERWRDSIVERFKKAAHYARGRLKH